MMSPDILCVQEKLESKYLVPKIIWVQIDNQIKRKCWVQESVLENIEKKGLIPKKLKDI